MGLKETLQGLLREPVLVALMVLCFVLAVLSVVFYFRALRPRRGTTEWMKRLERPKLSVFPAPSLHWSDFAWALVSVMLSVLLRFVYLFFWLLLHLRPNVFGILASASSFILLRLGLAAGLAVGIYLLLRCVFQKPLPAVCLAGMSGLFVSDSSDTLMLLVFSLLCLYLWMCVDDNKPLLPGAFWLLASGLIYCWALLTCWQAAWLAPFYLAAYVGKQFLRFYRGDPAHRGRKLVFSLILTVLSLILCLLFLSLVYVLLSARYEGDLLQNLRTLSFYRSLLPVVKEKVLALFSREMSFRESILAKDSLLFAFGAMSVIPLCHGLFRKKDLRCLWILILAAVFALPWLICGVYLMNLPMLLLLGYSWSVYCERRRAIFPLVYALLLSGSYIVLLY